MERINAQQAKEMLLYVAESIIEAKPMLTEVDSAIGDGDHGIGMAGGLKKAKDKLLKMEEPSDVYAVFAAAGKAMLMSMGGASGVIFGSMFLGGAKGMEPAAEIDAGQLIQESAQQLPHMYVSGGKLGMQLKLAPEDLRKAAGASFADVTHL